MNKFLLNITAIIVIPTALISCHKHRHSTDEKQHTLHTITIKPHRYQTVLRYRGKLSPITDFPILSPVDGNIVKRYFNYGQFVEKGQALVVINSEKFKQNYQDTITQFLKEKLQVENLTQSLLATKALYQAGASSHEDLLNAQQQLQTAKLSYYQIKRKLEKIVNKVGIDPNKIEKYSINNLHNINQYLVKHFENFTIRATHDGIVLFPLEKTGNRNTSELHKPIITGNEVKQNQLILSIGDLTGLSVYLKVNEAHITQLHKNLPVTVSSDDFPNLGLKGYIAQIAAQAQTNGNDQDAISTFEAVVHVPNITPSVRKRIRVGMHTNVTITIQHKPQILIPIAAVTTKNGKNYVMLIDHKTRDVKHVIVTTGTTTVRGKVVIKSGLQSGDKLVVP